MSSNQSNFTPIPGTSKGAPVPNTPSIDRILPRQINSGQLPGNTQLKAGSPAIVIDNANARILISDGTNIRVLIGMF